MGATATEIYDIFNGEWTREKAEQALGMFRKLAKGGVKAEVLERIEDRVEVQVEKSVLAKSQDLATKGDILTVKEDLRHLGGRVDTLLYCVVGLIVTIILGFAALVATLLPIIVKHY